MVPAKAVSRVQELVYEMQVNQVMVTDVITVHPDSRMSELRDLLREKRISGAPVVDGDRLVGLVSIEDFILYMAEGETDCIVGSMMSQEVTTLKESDPLVHAVEEFERYGYGRFPVIHHDTGQLVGIITKGDIVKGLLKKMEIDYHEEETLRSQDDLSLDDIISEKARFILRYKIIGQDFDHAGETSSKLKTALGRIGVPPDILRRVSIAAYEAEMNTVIYTDGGQLTARVTPHKITVEVHDNGPGIENIAKALEPGFSTAPDWVRELGFGAGMGLPNIKKCSDEMLLESTPGKETRLQFSVLLNRNGNRETDNHN